MTIEFEFNIDDKVVIKLLGIKGVVSACSINDSKSHSYYVVTEKGGEWYPERHLEKAE